MLKSSVRMVLLQLAAMTAGAWWELCGAAYAVLGGCGAAVCTITANAPQYWPANCQQGRDDANYGGSAKMQTGNWNQGPCAPQTFVTQSGQLYQVSSPNDVLITQNSVSGGWINCNIACGNPAKLNMTWAAYG